MRPRPSSADDPVVAEVRAVRARLWREAGGTVDGLIRLLEGCKLLPRRRAAVPRRRRGRAV